MKQTLYKFALVLLLCCTKASRTGCAGWLSLLAYNGRTCVLVSMCVSHWNFLGFWQAATSCLVAHAGVLLLCCAVLCCAVICRQLHGMSDFSALARVIPVAVAYRAAPLHVSLL
jgi:hypothetical protein